MPILSKLPRWIGVGAFVLAWLSGNVNAVAILHSAHTVSHMTGNNSELAISIARNDWQAVARFAGVIAAFFLGAACGGWVVKDSTLRLGRHYGAALAIETTFLILATLCFDRQMPVGIGFAAFACGIQNAMVTTYSGAVIRTTHVTGILTDLGILFGQRVRGLAIDHRRVKLFLLILAGFCAGGVTGAWTFLAWGSNALILPAMVSGAAACWFFIVI